jgi:hypothetical protein
MLVLCAQVNMIADVTLSVYPHRAGLKNMPGHGGIRTYDLWNQGRANRFLVGGGGVFQNSGGGKRPTLCSREQKFPKSFATQHFPENSIIQRANPSFFTNFAIPACQGPLLASWAPSPLLASWAPFFGGGGGCYTTYLGSPRTKKWYGTKN